MNSKATAIPSLLSHGEHIRAEYARGAWGESTDTERLAGNPIGTLKRFRKDQTASDKPQAMGWIKATYEHAIEYTGMKQQLEGMIMVGAFFGFMIGIGSAGSGAYLAAMPFTSSNTELPPRIYFFSMLLGGMTFVGLVLTIWSTLMPLRRVWRAPRDLPIIFDRQHRKVYRMLQDVQPGLKGLIKPWPVRACAYDWDLIDAEHDAQLMGATATAMRLHRLVFVVRKSADDPHHHRSLRDRQRHEPVREPGGPDVGAYPPLHAAKRPAPAASGRTPGLPP